MCCAKVFKPEVPDRFTIADHIYVSAFVICNNVPAGDTVINDLETYGINQLFHDSILTVIPVVSIISLRAVCLAILLDAVPVLVYPQIAFYCHIVIQQCNGNRIRSHRTL